MGAGAGRDTLYFQEQFETVAIEKSEHLVETMRERGVRDARHADMFALRDYFDRDRFRSALAFGTQVGLSGSMCGLRQFLSDLAFVTTPDATAVLHNYDPEKAPTADILGYRADPTPGLAYRVMHEEYGDDRETLLFRLFSPDRLREATIGTGVGGRCGEIRLREHVQCDIDETMNWISIIERSRCSRCTVRLLVHRTEDGRLRRASYSY